MQRLRLFTLCADSQIADKSFDLIANTLNREVHRWRPTREAFSSSLSAVISEWPGAVKGMILFVMAKLPLTARTIRGQLSSRKRPPTAERNHCKQSRRSNLLVLTPVSTPSGAANPGCSRLSGGFVAVRGTRPFPLLCFGDQPGLDRIILDVVANASELLIGALPDDRSFHPELSPARPTRARRRDGRA